MSNDHARLRVWPSALAAVLSLVFCAPAAAQSPPPSRAASMSLPEASRFLAQATFGPTMSEIESVAQQGASAWIEQQFNTPPMDSHWTYAMVRKGPIGCSVCNSEYINAVMESFWTQAAQGPDQLRQRVALALSEIFVVSEVNSSLAGQTPAMASYLDMLSRNAFGNYRTLLEEVSRHPAMAHYLSHMKNMKEDPATGRQPDENYAREVMQLFSIGLWQLAPNGTRRKDSQNRDIPTYANADVIGLAKVFTGWSWQGPTATDDCWNAWGSCPARWDLPLMAYPQYHSSSEKRFLGKVVKPNTSAQKSLQVALDTLYRHSNVGPFIGKQLIQRLVTSNPSPAYVARVTAAFNNNGSGVRGDMRAVIRAVLLDSEARNAALASGAGWGKVREPLLRFGQWLRAFDSRAQNGKLQIWNLEDYIWGLGQNPLRAPSVFNWFRPDYSPPGAISNSALVAPEFQITHETSTISYVNFVNRTVRDGYGWDAAAVRGNYSAEFALAGNPTLLVDRLNLLLLAGRMSVSTRESILRALNGIPVGDPWARVHTAITLTMVSPDYIVQK